MPYCNDSTTRGCPLGLLLLLLGFGASGCGDDNELRASSGPLEDGGLAATDTAGQDTIEGSALFVFSGVVGRCPRTSPGNLTDLSVTVNGDELLGRFGSSVGNIGMVKLAPGPAAITLAYDWYGCTDTFDQQTITLAPDSKYALVVGGTGPYSAEVTEVRDLTATYQGGVGQVLLANASSSSGVVYTLSSVGDGGVTEVSLAALDATGTPAQTGGSMVVATADDGSQLTATLRPVEAQDGVSTISFCLYRESDAGPELVCSWTVL